MDTKQQAVNIVCIDVPYPLNYGGALGSFDLIRRFNEAGFKIYLHVFHYKNEQNPEGLKQWASEIFIYPRTSLFSCIFSGKAFIVASRDNKDLRTNLRKYPFPIVCEGIHNSSIFDDPEMANRAFVRWHNVDSIYYRGLMKSENSFIKKCYFWLESRLIRQQEKFLVKNYLDRNYFLSKLDMESMGVQDNSKFIASALNPCVAIEGKGAYNIFHANLEISDNEHSAILAIQIGEQTDLKMIIAGRNPSQRLQQMVNKSTNSSLFESPSMDEMFDLIKNAHTILNISTINVGFKTRLISSLQLGRHQLSNYPSALSGEIDKCMIIEQDLAKWVSILNKLQSVDFRSIDIDKRNEAVESVNKMMGWNDLYDRIKLLNAKPL